MIELAIPRGTDLVLIWTWVHGPLGEIELSFVLDTGAAKTIIASKHLAALGLGPGDALGHSRIATAVGFERGYRYRVKRIASLGGYWIDDFEVCAHDLGPHPDIGGLLGWDFLRHFDLDIRPRLGLIRATPA